MDNPPDPVQYRLVSETFPGAVLEDPALEGPAREALRGQEGAVQLRRAHPLLGGRRGDDGAGGRRRAGPECDRFVLRQLNIKPSRFGSLSALLDCVERAQAAGMVLYGGGQFELGIGRDQIQALASLLYAGRPQRRRPARVPRRGARRACRGSPLVPLEEQGAGFGFASRSRPALAGAPAVGAAPVDVRCAGVRRPDPCADVR